MVFIFFSRDETMSGYRTKGGRHWSKPVSHEERQDRKKKGIKLNAGFYGSDGVMDRYLNSADELIRKHRYKEARHTLKIAQEIDPLDSRIKAKLEEIDSL